MYQALIYLRIIILYFYRYIISPYRISIPERWKENVWWYEVKSFLVTGINSFLDPNL